MLALAARLAWGHAPVTHSASPGDWCEVLASVPGGDFVALQPGDYYGPCVLVGTLNALYPGDFTTVLAADLLDPPVLHGDGVADVVLDVSGSNVLLSSLHIRDIPEGVTAIRLHDGDDLQARSLTATGVHGTFVHVGQNVIGARVSENVVDGGNGTAVEIGCAPACSPDGVEVSHNLVTNMATGIRVRSGASAWIHDEVIAWGADALRVEAGASAPGTIELGLFHSTATALDVSAPSLLRNVVVLGGLTRLSGDGITVTGSTVLGTLDGSGLLGASSVRNVALSAATIALPAGIDGGGNVACAVPDDCWLDASAWDLFPRDGGPLVNTGVADADLSGDWCNRARGDAISPGALEAIGTVGMGPIEVVDRYSYDCRLDPEPGDTGLLPVTYTATDTGAPSPPPLPPPAVHDTAAPAGPPLALDEGCACDGRAAGMLPFGLLAVLRRGRPGGQPSGALTVRPERPDRRGRWRRGPHRR